jgi:hypothetical protein
LTRHTSTSTPTCQSPDCQGLGDPSRKKPDLRERSREEEKGKRDEREVRRETNRRRPRRVSTTRRLPNKRDHREGDVVVPVEEKRGEKEKGRGTS